jgi:uncharacterized hydrophobic protein (TIGR00271 family)
MKASTPRALVQLQDRLVRLLGNTVDGRRRLVGEMLRRDANESASYWLQLVVSVGIATLGLVVGSSAVVIGAMLVAPLMGPIVGLGMGLAAGSPFLVLRSAGRVALSVIVAVGGAALITLLLPFHEMNLEISARTSPTVLDLITASFCALAGVYASVRPGSDTTTTAAGTAISVSLVPPLCASGYGIGTAAWPVAGGAALLFLTNLVAIVFVGITAFVASGFNRVDVVSLERDELGVGRADAPIARALALRLARVFASRWGPVLRFLMPFILLAAVYVPLRRALDEMAWEVRVRAAARSAIAGEPGRVVESRVRIERHEVELVLVLVGTTQDADRARARLDREIRRASGVAPRVEILAVPDATAFAGLESTLLKPRHIEVSSPSATPPAEQLDTTLATLRGAAAELWPKAIAGEPLVVDIGVAEDGPFRIRVVHLGAPLSADGAETFGRALNSKFGRDTRLVDVAVPTTPFTRDGGDLSFMAGISGAIRSTASVPGVNVCVVVPERAAEADAELMRAVEAVLKTHPRVTRLPGDAWSIRFMLGSCPDLAVDGGTPDGGGAP